MTCPWRSREPCDVVKGVSRDVGHMTSFVGTLDDLSGQNGQAGHCLDSLLKTLWTLWVHSGSSAQPRPFITVIRAQIRAGYPRRVDKPSEGLR